MSQVLNAVVTVVKKIILFKIPHYREWKLIRLCPFLGKADVETGKRTG